MSTTPQQVEPGQVWRDNDERSKGAGEFTIVGTFTGSLSHTSGVEFAIVKRDAGRRSRPIRVDRLLAGKAYRYIGRQR